MNKKNFPILSVAAYKTCNTAVSPLHYIAIDLIDIIYNSHSIHYFSEVGLHAEYMLIYVVFANLHKLIY